MKEFPKVERNFFKLKGNLLSLKDGQLNACHPSLAAIPDWKFFTEKTYSRPRDWSLSASLGTQLKTSLKHFGHHNSVLPRGLSGTLK